jgi:hypothetical protein
LKYQRPDGEKMNECWHGGGGGRCDTNSVFEKKRWLHEGAAYFESSKQFGRKMIVVIRMPCGSMVVQAFIVPRIGVALGVAEPAATLVLTFIARVRAPNTELPSRNGIDATKAMRLAVGAADADAIFERVCDILRNRKGSVWNEETFRFSVQSFYLLAVHVFADVAFECKNAAAATE